MARIAVDIDSTLYDFETVAREAFAKLSKNSGNEHYMRGSYHPWTEWRSPADVCGPEAWQEVIDLCHSREVIESRIPFAGAVETCQALVAEGHDLIYISNRGNDTLYPTRGWLDEWGFPLNKVFPYRADLFDYWVPGECVLKVLPGDKRPFIRDCQYLIDDRPKAVVDFVYDYDWQYAVRASAYDPNTRVPERKAFVIAYQYNQALTDIPNTYLAPTWAGINHYLASKGVLSEPAYTALGA